MIPEAIGIIDTLPLSRNGKVDRAELKRLPLLGRTQSKTAGIGDERDSYRSDLEARLAVEFSEVLGADSVRRMMTSLSLEAIRFWPPNSQPDKEERRRSG